MSVASSVAPKQWSRRRSSGNVTARKLAFGFGPVAVIAGVGRITGCVRARVIIRDNSASTLSHTRSNEDKLLIQDRSVHCVTSHRVPQTQKLAVEWMSLGRGGAESVGSPTVFGACLLLELMQPLRKPSYRPEIYWQLFTSCTDAREW